MKLPAPPDFRLAETRLIWIQDRLPEMLRKTNAITVEDIPAWLVRRGRLIVVTGDERVEAGAGCWVFPRQGEGWVHTLPGSKILSLRFRLRWPNGEEVYHRRRTLALRSSRWAKLARAAQGILGCVESPRLWLGEAWRPASAEPYFALQAHFQAWLAAYAEMMAAHGQTRGPLDEAGRSALETRRVLLEWALARPFSRRELAHRLGLGSQTASRRFIAHYGTTPRRFFEQRRHEWAREKLAWGGERIKAVAAELGFSNLAQFSNWFRARNRISPRDYRRLARAAGE
jgi:AraC-like DNA-binding protein